MDAARNNRITLSLALLLITAGLLFLFFQSGEGLARWLMRLWPVFVVCAGLTRVMGYAIDRKPRSPADGMLLIVIGVLILAGRSHPELNALQVYGRYWIMLLAIFAGVELIRYYSHRRTDGPLQPVFGLWRIMIVLLIVTTGVAASRIGNNPSMMRQLRLQRLLSELRSNDPATDLKSAPAGIMIKASIARQTFRGSCVNQETNEHKASSEPLAVALPRLV